MLTGPIIGMARALGESAPLLMIGMVAFIVDIPKGVTDASTVLPVQVFLWSDSPERGFVEKTSGAIIVLLAFLVVMNTTAVILRKKFERRWCTNGSGTRGTRGHQPETEQPDVRRGRGCRHAGRERQDGGQHRGRGSDLQLP